MKTPDCYGIVFSICYKFQSNDFLETNRLPRNKCFSLLTLGLLDNLFGATFHSPWFISVLSISVFSPWKSSVWSSESFLLWGFPNSQSWGACGDHQHGNNDAIKCDKHSFIGFGLLILRRNQFVIMFTSLYIADTFIFDTSWVSVLPVDWVTFFLPVNSPCFRMHCAFGGFSFTPSVDNLAVLDFWRSCLCEHAASSRFWSQTHWFLPWGLRTGPS